MSTCRYCWGTGRIPMRNDQEYICPDCRGTGVELEMDLQGRIYSDTDIVTEGEKDGQEAEVPALRGH